MSFNSAERKLLLKANAKSHTHLQFARANTTPKIAKEYVFVNAETQAERNKASG